MIRAKIYIILEILWVLIIPLIWITPHFKNILIVILLFNILLRMLLYKSKKKMLDNTICNSKSILDRVIFNIFMTDYERKFKLKTDWILDKEEISKKYNLPGQKTKFKEDK